MKSHSHAKVSVFLITRNDKVKEVKGYATSAEARAELVRNKGTRGWFVRDGKAIEARAHQTSQKSYWSCVAIDTGFTFTSYPPPMTRRLAVQRAMRQARAELAASRKALRARERALASLTKALRASK